MYRFGIIGKDARMEYLCKSLISDGYTAEISDTASKLSPDCDVIVLPIGMDLNAVSDIRHGKTVLCGVPSDGDAISYTDCEYFKIRNAKPTAEGALLYAMQSNARTVSDCKSAVVGYGNIGRCLTDLILRMGGSVCVYARRDTSRAKAENSGAFAKPISDLVNTDADIVFNTVPAPVIDKSVLECLDTDTVITDLASRPGGTDFEYAKSLGIQAVHLPGIPGRYAPATAGGILKDTVLSLLRGVK